MAIKPNRNKPKLSIEQVQKIRHDFFNNMDTIDEITDRYPVSKTTIKDAIHGRGSYTNVPDDIDDQTKENRIQWRTFLSTPKSKKARETRLTRKFMDDYYRYQNEKAFGGKKS